MKLVLMLTMTFVTATFALTSIKSTRPTLASKSSSLHRISTAQYLLPPDGTSESGSNMDMFGGSKRPVSPPPMTTRAADQNSKLLDEAARLRQEASEMEVALREEARAKGVPEEMINKLIPIRNPKGTTIQATEQAKVVIVVKMAEDEIRSSLGYLNTGDAVRFTAQLDKLKQKGIMNLWNSVALPSQYGYNQVAFKSKTNLEPNQLKLDSAGFNYQATLGIAVIVATIFALLSTQIGGQIGFLLGYASALFPVLLIGVGSIAPGLIADILNQISYSINTGAKNKYITCQAGKFLCGYLLGLPLTTFKTGGSSNTCEFFQLRPDLSTDFIDEINGKKKMFAKNEYKQSDIARACVTAIAGPIAECIKYGDASGTAASDVNTLYELMNAVQPSLSPDKQQDHIRWSAVVAYELLKKNNNILEKLCIAFGQGVGLEECISIIEASE